MFRKPSEVTAKSVTEMMILEYGFRMKQLNEAIDDYEQRLQDIKSEEERLVVKTYDNDKKRFKLHCEMEAIKETIPIYTSKRIETATALTILLSIRDAIKKEKKSSKGTAKNVTEMMILEYDSRLQQLCEMLDDYEQRHRDIKSEEERLVIKTDDDNEKWGKLRCEMEAIEDTIPLYMAKCRETGNVLGILYSILAAIEKKEK